VADCRWGWGVGGMKDPDEKEAAKKILHPVDEVPSEEEGVS
jgi:hypothetical protein